MNKYLMYILQIWDFFRVKLIQMLHIGSAHSLFNKGH